MQWRKNEGDFARLVDLEKPPKDLKNRISLGVNDVAIGLGTRPEIFTNTTIKIKALRKENKYSRLIFFDSNERRSSIPVKGIVDAGQELLKAEVGYQFRIDGDIGALKLSESILFSKEDQVSDASLKEYIREYCSGHWKSIFDGVTQGNRREVETSTRVSARIEILVNSAGKDLGLVFSNVSVRWRASDEELSTHNRKRSRDKINKLDSELEKSGTEKLLADKKFRRNMKKRRTQTLQKEFENQESERLKDITRGSELKEIRHEGEKEHALLQNEEDLKDLQHSREMERQRERMNLNLEVERKRSEIRIKEESAKTATAAQRLAIYEAQGIDPLKIDKIYGPESLVLNLNGTDVDLNRFIADIRERLDSGAHSASEIDAFISNLEVFITNDMTLTSDALSDIYAILAQFHYHRGNKEGKMEEYITKSLSLNEANPTSIRTKLDYLWNRHPQQFSPRKSKKFKHQLEEIRDLIDKLRSIYGSSSYQDMQDMMERSNIVSEALLNCR